MKASVILFFGLVSCTQHTIEATKVVEPVEKPKPAIRERLVPGTTYGNAALQAETIETLKEAFVAKDEHASCLPKRLEVSDTWALGEPAPSDYSSVFHKWRELWTLDACGSSAEFEVVYMLHKSGFINVSASQVQKGQAVALD